MDGFRESRPTRHPEVETGRPLRIALHRTFGNANYSRNGVNATLTNASWNPSIPPETTLNGAGFNAGDCGSNPPSTTFYVHGTRCQ